MKDDIESEFFWSSFVDSDHVSVEVENGVATVYGVVDDWDDVLDVEENAREGGARAVINRLTVRNPKFGPGGTTERTFGIERLLILARRLGRA